MSKPKRDDTWRYVLLLLGVLTLLFGGIVALFDPGHSPSYYPTSGRYGGVPLGTAPAAIFVGALLLWLGWYGWNREKK